MASLPNSKSVTYEEWLRMPEVRDAIEEVVNGEIRIMPPAKFRHALIVHRLSTLLNSKVNPLEVLVLTTSFGLIINKSPLTSRVPDLAVFQANTIVEQDGYIHSAPQLIIEVLSPGNSRREREEKLDDYATLGVPEVWVVSPEGLTVEVLHLKEGQLRTTDVLKTGLLKPLHFPGVQIDVTQIWPD